mgnify:CR=1 FL=1
MHSLHSAIRYGGIGDIIPMVPDGAGDGHILTMDGVVTIPVTGVAGMAAVIGDITTTGTVVLAGAGAEVEAVIGQVLPIRIVVLPDKAVTEIRLVNMVQVLPVQVVALLFVLPHLLLIVEEKALQDV